MPTPAKDSSTKAREPPKGTGREKRTRGQSAESIESPRLDAVEVRAVGSTLHNVSAHKLVLDGFGNVEAPGGTGCGLTSDHPGDLACSAKSGQEPLLAIQAIPLGMGNPRVYHTYGMVYHTIVWYTIPWYGIPWYGIPYHTHTHRVWVPIPYGYGYPYPYPWVWVPIPPSLGTQDPRPGILGTQDPVRVPIRMGTRNRVPEPGSGTWFRDPSRTGPGWVPGMGTRNPGSGHARNPPKPTPEPPPGRGFRG